MTGEITEYRVPTPTCQPFAITAGPDGALWFTELNTNNIGRISVEGVITEYNVPSSGLEGNLSITTGSDGALWFAEQTASAIGRITIDGVVTQYFVPQSSSPYAITAGPDGALWFTEFFGNAIGRITTAGEISEYPTFLSDNPGGGICVGPDGALWFTEYSAIGRITTQGVVTTFPMAYGFYGPPITAGPDGALWLAQTASPLKMGRFTTTGVLTEFPWPAGVVAGGHVAAGPDGGMWFTPGRYILRAPACGLGFSATFSGDTLNMNFNLGINEPAIFSINVRASSGDHQPLSRSIPTVVPVQPFSLTWTDFPDLGDVVVQPLLTTSSGELICSEWTHVNTTP